MDTLGFEPRASRMLSGCDTATPCAQCEAIEDRFVSMRHPRGTSDLRRYQVSGSGSSGPLERLHGRTSSWLMCLLSFDIVVVVVIEVHWGRADQMASWCNG